MQGLVPEPLQQLVPLGGLEVDEGLQPGKDALGRGVCGGAGDGQQPLHRG